VGQPESSLARFLYDLVAGVLSVSFPLVHVAAAASLVVRFRFNRRRHDAGQTIAAFGARLRDQVDLDTLRGELLAVVDQTMQPTRASLWLRPRS
jgi:hypothetical protein